MPHTSNRIGVIVLAIVGLASLPGQAQARGGLGGYLGEGYHLAGVSTAYGGVSMGSTAGVHPGYSYGRVHFHPDMGYYQPASQPAFHYAPGLGGLIYNPRYANPDVYHNPYMYHPNINPYSVPFTHPF